MPSPSRRFWLFKSEPDVFGVEHLALQPQGVAMWDGVRSYRARNYLRDEVSSGDGALFYHSSCASPAIVAECEIVRGGYPDPTQFDPTHPGYDPKSSAQDPRWYTVDVGLRFRFAAPVTLAAIKKTPALAKMFLISPAGGRLSIQPVTAVEWREILRRGGVTSEGKRK